MDDWVMGIDPGKDGGVAVLRQDNFLEVWRMPKRDAEIIRLFHSIASLEGDCRRVSLESVWGQRGNAMKAVTTFMKGTGFLKGCVYNSFYYVRKESPLFFEVIPQVWQRGIGAPKSQRDPAGKKTVHIRKRKHKNALKDMAFKMWPEIKFTLCTCDAALIAAYSAKEVWGDEIQS